MKKRIFSIIAVLASLTFMNTTVVKATISQSMVRVGLVSQKNARITIENKTLSLGFDKNGTFQKEATLHTTGSFSAYIADKLYLRVNQSFTSYEQARNYGSSLGLGDKVAVAYLDANSWAVYLGGYGSQAEATAGNNLIGGKGSLVNANEQRVLLTDEVPGGIRIILEKNPHILAEGEPIKIGQHSYRGRIEMLWDAGLLPVNVLTLDEYLYAVVPVEMPAHWPLEALKAQAVAARNYTLTRDGHSSVEYSVCDSSHCQNYSGIKKETEATTRAVNETEGIMVYYNREPINAMYFSSSGGTTESSENVWANNMPYLRGIRDLYEAESKSWSRTYSYSEIQTALTAKGINIGQVTGVSITALSSSNRVNQLTIKGSTGNKVLIKEEIRSFFSSLKGGILESRNFTLGNMSSFSQLQATGKQPHSIQRLSSVAAQQPGLPVMEQQNMVNGDFVLPAMTKTEDIYSVPVKNAAVMGSFFDGSLSEVSPVVVIGGGQSTSYEKGNVTLPPVTPPTFTPPPELALQTPNQGATTNNQGQATAAPTPISPSLPPNQSVQGGTTHPFGQVQGLPVMPDGSKTVTAVTPIVPPAVPNAPVSLNINTIASNLLNSSGQSVTFTGIGWGHGVGLSQFGAKGMAEKGFNYKQILEYYFTGVQVY